MSDFVTIATFMFPHEAGVPQALLDSEGIESFIRDETTVQVYNFYSNAMGGLRLQVKEEDAERAIHVLIAGGYLKESVAESETFPLEMPGETETSTQPIANADQQAKSINGRKLLIIGGICALLLTLFIYYATRPSFEDKLTAKSWCVRELYYNGQPLHVQTTGIRIVFAGRCLESIRFERQRYTVEFPGIESNATNGSWDPQEEQEQIVVKGVAAQGDIYNGTYKVRFSGDHDEYMELKSNTTTISLYQDAW